MSYWDHWHTSSPKKPPPQNGIRMTKAGTTWWGRRWIEALQQVLRGDSARLARGRTYARAGRTHDLVVSSGEVSAKVTGSRPRPYEIEIQVTPIDDVGWEKAIAGMAAKAQFSAELLAGQMPQSIEEVFQAAGLSLFPKDRSDLRTSCSCPDWGDPCKHVAATHYVLGEAFDRDPFLLFELRGRTKDRVLDALRRARGAEAAPTKRARKRGAAAEPKVAGVRLGKLSASTYDQPREAFPALRLTFDEPVSHGAVLRQLGAPAAWSSESSPAEVLAPLVRSAAEAARRIAMAPSEEKESPGEESPRDAKPDDEPRRRRPKPPARRRRA